MGFKDVILGVLMVGLFAIALITFGFNMQVNNDTDQNIINHSALSAFNSTLGSNLSSVESDAQDQRSVFEEQSAQGGDETFGLTSIISVSKKFTSMMFGTLNSLSTMAHEVLGIPKIVMNVILGIMVITVILLGWRVIRAGGT